MLIPIKPYIGSFSAKSPNCLLHKDFIYELYFEAILGVASDLPLVKTDMKNAKGKARLFFDRVDDCVFGGSFEYYRKDGSYCNNPYFLVRVDNKVGVVDENLNVLIDVDYEEIIAPIRTSKPLFVVRNKKNQWFVIDASRKSILIHPGTYYKIWGFDQNHALVSRAYEKEFSTGTQRAIIDIHGKLVYGSDKYANIYPFYGNGVDYIIVREKPQEFVGGKLINNHLSFRRKDMPQNIAYPDNQIIEAPKTYHYNGPGACDYDIMDAYDGDYDALWNTD